MAMTEPFYFEGGSNAVILLHIYSGSPNDVRVMGRQLQKQGLTVVGPQLIGHGTGDPMDIVEKGSPVLWWQQIVQTIDQLTASGHEQIAILGESLGGIFAIQALERFDQIVGGGTINSPLVPTNTDKVLQRFLADSRQLYEREKVPSEATETRIEWLTENAPAQLKSISAYTEGITEDLSDIHVPVFIAASPDDELIDPQVGAKLRDQLAGQVPVDYHEYPGAAHAMTYSLQSKQLIDDLGHFLTRIFE